MPLILVFYMVKMGIALLFYNFQVLEKRDSIKKIKSWFTMILFFMVRMKGLEPPRFWHWFLRPARLPVPPHPHILLTIIIITQHIFFCQAKLLKIIKNIEKKDLICYYNKNRFKVVNRTRNH